MNRRHFIQLASATGGCSVLSNCDGGGSAMAARTVISVFAPSLLGALGIVACSSLFLAYLQAMRAQRLELAINRLSEGLALPVIDNLRQDKNGPSGGLNEVSGYTVDNATEWAENSCMWPSVENHELSARLACQRNGARVLFGVNGKDKRSGQIKFASTAPLLPSSMVFLSHFATMMSGVGQNVPTSGDFPANMWMRLLPGLGEDSETCDLKIDPDKTSYSTKYGILSIANKGGGDYTLEHKPHLESKGDEFEIEKIQNNVGDGLNLRLLALDTNAFA